MIKLDLARYLLFPDFRDDIYLVEICIHTLNSIIHGGINGGNTYTK